MPATPRPLRACALALAGLGLSASTLTALPANADDGGDSTEITTTTTERTSAKRLATRVVGAKDIALRQRGDAYAYGASGPDRFDCSGLIHYSYRRAGISVPRTSDAQAGAVRRVARKDLRPGDLMFFYSSGGVYHAGIFLRWSHGRALMVHSPRSGSRVHVSAPWTSQWFGGTLRRG